jgi:hypothetical protein
MDKQHHEAKYFDMGTGHVNASMALDLCLMSDIDANEYGRFICRLLGEADFRTITKHFSSTDGINLG